MPIARLRCLALPAVLLLAPATSAAQARHACASEADPQARLACYDRAFPPVDGAVAAESPEARSKRQAEEFGLSQRQRDERLPEAERESKPDRIAAAVVSVAAIGDGKRRVRLDNGQSWVLTEARSNVRVEAGDRVTIRNASLGTFMLVTPSGTALRARRAQ